MADAPYTEPEVGQVWNPAHEGGVAVTVFHVSRVKPNVIVITFDRPDGTRDMLEWQDFWPRYIPT